MERTIKVNVKSNYGTQNVYVVSEHEAAIRMLTGCKTLTDHHRQALKLLGFDFEVETPKL